MMSRSNLHTWSCRVGDDMTKIWKRERRVLRGASTLSLPFLFLRKNWVPEDVFSGRTDVTDDCTIYRRTVIMYARQKRPPWAFPPFLVSWQTFLSLFYAKPGPQDRNCSESVLIYIYWDEANNDGLRHPALVCAWYIRKLMPNGTYGRKDVAGVDAFRHDNGPWCTVFRPDLRSGHNSANQIWWTWVSVYYIKQ